MIRITIYLLIFLLLFSMTGCAHHTPDIIQLRDEAYLAYQNGNYPQAVEKFEFLVQQVPKDAELWFRLGNSYARVKLPQQAVEAYRNALLRDPEIGKAWYNMGLIQMQEALKSYIDMQEYVAPDDPTFVMGKRMSEGLLNLLGPETENRDER